MPSLFTQDILDALAPMLYAEADTGGALTLYLTALSRPYDLVEDWASDTATAIGWSLLVDVDRCPVEALPWLAQLVGIRLISGLSEFDQRATIRSLQNWRRGTPMAMTSAVAPFLVGNKTVLFRERYDGTVVDAPYNLEVVTYDSETPDPVVVEAALRAAKPAGLIMDYQVNIGQDWQSVKDNFATFQAVKNAYLTLSGLRADEPGA